LAQNIPEPATLGSWTLAGLALLARRQPRKQKV
jgi:hypothetical protein